MAGVVSRLAKLLQDNDVEGALGRALEIWQKKPVAIIADLIRDISPPKRPWFSELIDGGNSVASKKLLEVAVAKATPDPRVFDGLVAMFEHPSFDIAMGNPRKLYEAIVEMMYGLSDHDTRVAPWVKDIETFFKVHKGTRHGQLNLREIDAAREMFAAHRWKALVVPGLDANEQAEVEEARALLGARQAAKQTVANRGDELFQNVIAHWDDDEHKVVYADWLLEQGDTRGEFILLELRGTDLDEDQERRRRHLVDRAMVFQPMGRRFEKGFAVEARFKGHDGNRYGKYGTELTWGTIQKADVPPTSDECHTENLRELELGSTYVADLAKLTKPIGLTHLIWERPTKTARAKWKKTTSLPKLEKLTLTWPGPELDFLLTEGPGKTVRELMVRRGDPRREEVAWLRSLFDKSPALERAEIEGRVTFVRTGKRLVLKLRVRDITDRASLETAVAGLAPVDEVEVQASGEKEQYKALLAVGKTGVMTFAPSVVAEEAKRIREDDKLTIQSINHALFDPDALMWVLSQEKDVKRVVIVDGVALDQLGAYWTRSKATLDELTLHQLRASWNRNELVMRVTQPNKLVIETTHREQSPMILDAVRSLSPSSIELHHSPNYRDLESLVADLKKLKARVKTTPSEEIYARLFGVHPRLSTKRVEIRGHRYGYLPTPATLDLLLSRLEFDPKVVIVELSDLDPKIWSPWCKRTKRTLSFKGEGREHITLTP